MALFSRNTNHQNNGTMIGLQNKIQNYIENYGLTAEEVMQKIQAETIEEAVRQEDFEKYGIAKEEKIPVEIKIISQALAYREANREEDFEEIFSVLNQSYQEEIYGTESFRKGESVAVTKDVVRQYLEDESYHWMVAEAPNGHRIEKDGIIIGVACFSADGISKRNGVVEGHVGSIRFFGILTRFRGLCVGRRFLSKIEDLIFHKYNCVRVLACIPSCRESMRKWIEQRDYLQVASIPFPFQALHYEPLETQRDTQLLQFVKFNTQVNDTFNNPSSVGSTTSALLSTTTRSETHLPPIFRKQRPVISDMQHDDEDQGDQAQKDEVLAVD